MIMNNETILISRIFTSLQSGFSALKKDEGLFNRINVFPVADADTGTNMLLTADGQLAAFKRDPNNKGKILQSGLWKTSRHPNYFGESLVWLGLAIMSLAYPWGWLALISPAVITYLLLFVSGIPIQEKGKDQNTSWREYASKTPKFLPFIGSKKM